MIYDIIEQASRYFEKRNKFYWAIKYAVDFDISQPDGDYEVKRMDIIAKVQSYKTSPAEQRTFESHRLYADIQIMRQGSERQDVVIAEKLEPLRPYQDQKDVTEYNPPNIYSSVVLHPGQFVVYYPEDIHRPNCSIGCDSKMVRKICMKVKL